MRSVFLWLAIATASLTAQTPGSLITIARLKYGGGGDWYGNKSSLNHLLGFLRQSSNLRCDVRETYIEPSDLKLFEYPVLYMSGHGNVRFSDADIRNLRIHLSNGGFLWCDDDYGIDAHFRREMKRVFPEEDFVPLPFSHPIFSVHYRFPQGLPKIHEHDGGPPEAYGLFHQGRLVCFYSKNTDISDGLEGPAVFPEDGDEKHQLALRMGANIILYALTY